MGRTFGFVVSNISTIKFSIWGFRYYFPSDQQAQGGDWLFGSKYDTRVSAMTSTSANNAACPTMASGWLLYVNGNWTDGQMSGNFDSIGLCFWVHFYAFLILSSISQRYAIPHAPYDVLYLAPMLLGLLIGGCNPMLCPTSRLQIGDLRR